MNAVTNGVHPDLDIDELRSLYEQMLLMRRFEERAIELRLAGDIYGVVHPYIGQEAIAAGICSELRRSDAIISTHRGHGHCIAKGADPARMMAELLGRRDGYCSGKGGSMHIAAFDVGMLGANGIVAGGLPIAAGAALAFQMSATDRVAVAFFGDGATGEGAFHEALNLSALWKLPVVWVCENNQYASDTPLTESVPVEIVRYAHGYGMPSRAVDGNDVLAVRREAREAVQRARTGGGPTLLECRTWRASVHALRDRMPTDPRVDAVPTDPLRVLEQTLFERGVDPSELAVHGARVDEVLQAAIAFAKASPFPDLSTALDDVFAP